MGACVVKCRLLQFDLLALYKDTQTHIRKTTFYSIKASAAEMSRMLKKWVTVSSHGCGYIQLHSGGTSQREAAAAGRLLVIRINRAEFSRVSVWNANPHCHKASFSLTKGWRHKGVSCVFVCCRGSPDKRGTSLLQIRTQ